MTTASQGLSPGLEDLFSVVVRNNSAEQIPAYGVMRVEQIDGNSYAGGYTVQVNKPQGTDDRTVLINSPTPIDPERYGLARNTYPALVAYDDDDGAFAPSVGQVWRVDKNKWELTADGSGVGFDVSGILTGQRKRMWVGSEISVPPMILLTITDGLPVGTGGPTEVEGFYVTTSNQTIGGTFTVWNPRIGIHSPTTIPAFRHIVFVTQTVPGPGGVGEVEEVTSHDVWVLLGHDITLLENFRDNTPSSQGSVGRWHIGMCGREQEGDPAWMYGHAMTDFRVRDFVLEYLQCDIWAEVHEGISCPP